MYKRQGSYFFGVKGNGKYSKYDLELQEIDITDVYKRQVSNRVSRLTEIGIDGFNNQLKPAYL